MLSQFLQLCDSFESFSSLTVESDFDYFCFSLFSCRVGICWVVKVTSWSLRNGIKRWKLHKNSLHCFVLVLVVFYVAGKSCLLPENKFRMEALKNWKCWVCECKLITWYLWKSRLLPGEPSEIRVPVFLGWSDTAPFWHSPCFAYKRALQEDYIPSRELMHSYLGISVLIWIIVFGN